MYYNISNFPLNQSITLCNRLYLIYNEQSENFEFFFSMRSHSQNVFVENIANLSYLNILIIQSKIDRDKKIKV